MGHPVSSSHPVSITAWPLVVTGPAGHLQTEQVHVKNSGSSPLHVTASTLRLGGACGKLKINPSTFTLAPGKVETVAVHTPNGATEDYVALLTGSSAAKGIKTGASVGSRLIIGKPVDKAGGCTIHRTHPVAAPLHGPGINPLVWVVVALAVLLVLGGAWTARKLRRTS
jgi:hypothetical protein